MNVAAGMWRQGGPIGGGKEALAGFDPHLAAEQAVAVRHARRDDVRAINAGILAPEHEAALIFDMLRDQRTSAGILPSGVNGIYLGETPIDRLQNGAVIYAADEHFRGRTGESTDEIIHRWEVGDTNLRDVPFEIIEGLLGVAVVTHAPMFLAGLAAPLGLDAIKAKLSGKTLEHARDLAWIDVAPRLVKLVNGITALAVAASGIGVGGGVVKKLAEGDHSQLDNSPHSPDGKPPIKALGFLAAASAFLAACREFLKTGQLPTVEVTQVAVTPSTDLGQAPEPSKTPPPTETPVPPTPEVFLGVSSIDQISAVPGIPAGFGGPGGQELVRNTAEFQAHLNESGFAPVVNEEGVAASLLSLDGDRLCVGNTPEKLFNPNVESGEDTLLRSEAGVFQFGDAATGEVRVQVLSAVPLNGLPDTLTCVEAVVVDPNNPAGLGALRMLLVDRSTNTIVGEMPAAFSGSDTVEIVWTDDAPMVRVNGKELHFQFRPEWITATPPIPTETPTPPATEKPRYSECGLITRLVNGGWYGEYENPPKGLDGNFMPTGVVKEEYKNGGFNLFEASVCLGNIEGMTDPVFPNSAVRFTIIVYDKNGVGHQYPAYVGGESYKGQIAAIPTCEGFSCRNFSPQDALDKLKELSVSESRLFGIEVRVSDAYKSQWAGAERTNRYTDILRQLYEALKKGENFPDVPGDDFIINIGSMDFNQ